MGLIASCIMSLGVGCEPQILGSLESAAGGGGIVGSTVGAIGRGGAGVVPLGGANTSIAGGAGTGGILGQAGDAGGAGVSGSNPGTKGCLDCQWSFVGAEDGVVQGMNGPHELAIAPDDSVYVA